MAFLAAIKYLFDMKGILSSMCFVINYHGNMRTFSYNDLKIHHILPEAYKHARLKMLHCGVSCEHGHSKDR